jgi:hypothetical protein
MKINDITLSISNPITGKRSVLGEKRDGLFSINAGLCGVWLCGAGNLQYNRGGPDPSFYISLFMICHCSTINGSVI